MNPLAAPLFLTLILAIPLTSSAEVVADTKFSVDRGYYEEPILVEISTETEGADIYYTTNGEKPGLGSIFTGPIGTLYEGPISIDRTTVLRAKAFLDGCEPSNTDTHSYLFLADILKQSEQPEGAPEKWGARTPDYEMDPRVVDDPAYSEAIVEGFETIRTLSLVVDPDDFFSSKDGIYANPLNDGRAWEREVSLEFIHPDGTTGAQANAGIRIHGNGSRNANGQPKHGFRVEFRGEYGNPRLNYRLFPNTPVDSFDNLILRGQNAHGWTRSSQIGNSAGTEREQSQYIRDSYARDLMKAMGHTYVHLFINGLYWGLYNPVEYPRTAFGVSHFGGLEEDYDVINRRTVTTSILNGTFDDWNAMQDLANSGLETAEKYAAIQEHINLDNLIDYMLMHQYMGSRDGPEVFNSNNMRAIRKKRGDVTTTWIGMPWDMEASMFEINVKRNINVDDPNTLVRVYTKLRENPEFLLRYGDHVHQHFFNGGVMTPERAAAIWEVRTEEIETAIIGESARWGDFRRATRPFTRDLEWEAERTRLLEEYFPTRTAFLLKELKANGLYPDTAAPEFSQHGGTVSAGFNLTMQAGTIFSPQGGTFYYTTDGSDPRLTGDEIAPGAMAYENGVTINASVFIRGRTFDEGQWSALNEAFFYVGSTDANSENVVVSEIMYHPETEPLSEYIELHNPSNQTVHLHDVYFERVGNQGIRFDFGELEIAAGATLLIVRDQAVFETTHGKGLPVAGEWTGGALSNAGEWLLLKKGTETLHMFRYNDKKPWPKAADGEGDSLIAPLDGSEVWASGPPTPGVLGSAPTAAKFTVEISRQSDGTIRLEWLPEVGKTDRVEFSTDLTGPWQTRPASATPG
ncbi:MAG: chitobiase/beta-hexosaminidase C-terminal domain-containing protein, partial [Verrucomicrobiales bacterium]